jgi:hypothetical protein
LSEAAGGGDRKNSLTGDRKYSIVSTDEKALESVKKEPELTKEESSLVVKRIRSLIFQYPVLLTIGLCGASM